MQEEFDQKMAQVVYYLCRNGKVESPHMIDVEFHSPGLRLRDVKLRLTTLRGSRMPAMYSWSFKRIYKNTSIWQDVSDDDFVLPVLSGEYVLKGSEIVDHAHGQVLKSQSLKQPAELLQRKFWGAESWLTSPGPTMAHRKSWEQQQQQLIPPRPGSRRLLSVGESSSSDERETLTSLKKPGLNLLREEGVRHSTGSILQDESKVYSIKQVPMIDHGCDATTQTEELRRRNQAGSSEPERKACIVEEMKKELVVSEITLSPATIPQEEIVPVKKHHLGFRLRKQDKELKSSKNGSSWMFLHVLSYCGASGLDTKAQQGGSTPLVVNSMSDQSSGAASVAGGENFSFSDTSRETQQSRSSTAGDSFNSSDASDEGRAQNFVDVKELLANSRAGGNSGAAAASSGKTTLLGRNYGRLSKSGSYWPRNIKYDLSRRQPELNCYNAE